MRFSTFVFRLFVFLFIPIAAAVGTYIFLKSNFLIPADPENKNVVLFEIPSGHSFKQICYDLETKGLVKKWWTLSLLSRFGGNDTKIKAGEYELSPSMKPREILSKLLSGEVFKRSILVREGLSIWDIGKLVEEAGLITAEEFNKGVMDRGLLTTAGIKSESFEGYLFPETYYFSRPITAKEIIWKMLEEGEQHWNPEYTDRANELNLSRHEIITLASIIEKESGNAEEQPNISSVFHNRLGQGMRLQSDPTVIYGIKDFNGNLTKADLSNPHAYNTYVNFGLPPGPICNPGASAIKAALYPADTNYLFFVGNGAGSHVFSSSLAEHNQAVVKYQINREKPPVPSPSPSPSPGQP